MIWPFSLSQPDIEQLERMATELMKSITPEQTANPAQALSVNKTTKAIERLVKTFHSYNQERRLGYFARVRFFHQLEWRLRDGGYTKAFVDLVLEGLLMSQGKPGQTLRKP